MSLPKKESFGVGQCCTVPVITNQQKWENVHYKMFCFGKKKTQNRQKFENRTIL